MSGDGWDELLGEAKQRLREQQQQEQDANADLGDEMTPGPEEHFAGRWRGEGQMQTKTRGLIDVYFVWDRDNNPGFLYRHARLVQEVDAEKPQVGDRVLVLRGPDGEYEKDGETRTFYPYVLRRQECADPLPGQPVIEGGNDAKDEIPFLCPDGNDSRSARSAAAATASV